MKLLSLILSVILVCANAVDHRDALEQWTKFQAEFGKNYRSPLEARKRFSIFQDNLDLIEAHNNLFENGQVTYTKGINQFADWTQREFLDYVNKGLVNETLKGDNVFNKTEGFVAPESVDWREEGIVTPVKDQGTCGGCWAFSATGALEGQLAKAENSLVSLSEQCLIDCSKNGENDGCNGGLMTDAFDYVKNNGIDSEADYPYKGRDGKCRANEFKPVAKSSGCVNVKEGDEEALTEAIATAGPVSVGVDASWDFQFYSSGIFTGSCSSRSLNHGILAVGFGIENGIPYYIVKNSWGEVWGEKGYIRIERNSNNKCGIASLASYPQL